MTTDQPASMPPSMPGPAPGAPQKKPSRAPLILMIVGGAILALSVIIGIVITVIGIGSLAGGITDLEEMPDGTGTISAESGDVLTLYVEEGAPAPACTVTGPGPDSIGSGTAQTSEIEVGGTSWTSFDSFTANDAGQYEFECGGTPIAVGPPVSVGGIFGAVGGILIGLGGGVVGFILLVIGIVLTLMRRRRAA